VDRQATAEGGEVRGAWLYAKRGVRWTAKVQINRCGICPKGTTV